MVNCRLTDSFDRNETKSSYRSHEGARRGLVYQLRPHPDHIDWKSVLDCRSSLRKHDEEEPVTHRNTYRARVRLVIRLRSPMASGRGAERRAVRTSTIRPRVLKPMRHISPALGYRATYRNLRPVIARRRPQQPENINRCFAITAAGYSRGGCLQCTLPRRWPLLVARCFDQHRQPVQSCSWRLDSGRCRCPSSPIKLSRSEIFSTASA